MATLLAILTSLLIVLGPQAAQPAAHCELNPQTDSLCQPGMLPVGWPVMVNGEAGTIWGYYLEGSGQYVYVVLLDAQQNGVWVGRFAPASEVAPR